MTDLLATTALLATLCLVSDCELQAGLGYQPYEPVTHDYAQALGEVRLSADIGERFYAACTHISGINTPEEDYGMNYCSAGFSVRF